VNIDRRIKELERRFKPKVKRAMESYRNNPVAYAYEVLRVKHLSSDQEKILRYVGENWRRCRLLVPSANETGKSFLAAILASWHYDCFYPTLTIITAPSQATVHDVIFRELRRLRRGDRNFLPKADRIEESEDRICVGYTASGDASFQGRHDASVMGIYDEAEGIDAEFITAGETFLDIFVMFYNPTQAASAVAVEERSRQWHIIRMSALNHPNVIAALNGGEPPIPNAVTLEKVVHRLNRWATVLRECDPEDPREVVVNGVRYLPGPAAEARVLGIRPTKPVNAVYSSDQLWSIESVPREIKPHWLVQLGCDVAHFGDDFTVIHARRGTCSIHHEAHNGWDVDQTAERLRQLAVMLSKDTPSEPTEIPIVIDDVGYGGALRDPQRARGFKFLGFNVSKPSDKIEEYPNLRSQLYFDFEDLLKHRLVDMSRIPESARHDIIEQLQVACYEFDNKGRRTILPKKKLKELLGRSPDDADAVLLAYYQYPETLEVYR
jgi:hypothetical protein